MRPRMSGCVKTDAASADDLVEPNRDNGPTTFVRFASVLSRQRRWRSALPATRSVTRSRPSLGGPARHSDTFGCSRRGWVDRPGDHLKLERMVPSGHRGGHEKDAIQRGADGHDSSRGQREAGRLDTWRLNGWTT